MPADNRLLADRLVIAAVVLARWLRAADPSPRLSGPQTSALAIIVHSGGITPSALAALEEVKRPTIARTVAQLETLGLVARHRDGSDGRSVRLVATAQGRTLLDAGQQRRLRPLISALDELSKEERQALTKALPVLESILLRETRR